MEEKPPGGKGWDMTYVMLWLEWWKPFGIAEKAAKLNFRIHVSTAKTQHLPHGL